MKRATSWVPSLLLPVLIPVLLSGCDAGKEPLARAAAVEAAGNLPRAAELYRSVCDMGSALCPIATRQAERLKLTEAYKALGEGAYQKARVAVDAALASSDAGVKRAAEALSKLPDLEKGLIWEDASASPNQDEALAKIEAVAEAGVSASPLAKEWLGKNRPRLLLARVKAVCTPKGQASCAATGKELATRHPTSPENAAAQKLVEADYARIYPLLDQADRMLALRLMFHDKDLTTTACKAAASSTHDMPECASEEDPEPESEAPPPTLESLVTSLTERWTQLLDQIHDPHYVKLLNESWESAAKGTYAADTWPKPAAHR